MSSSPKLSPAGRRWPSQDEIHNMPEIELDQIASLDAHLTEAEAQPPSHAVGQADIPPNGGYGWICTACVFMVNAHTWGVNSAWGVILDHYLTNSTFPGASRFEYALIGGLSISQSLIIAPLVSASNIRLGTHVTLLLGTGLVALSLFGASFATTIWHLFLSQGICFGWGMGFLYITATAVLPQWFSSRRSLAMGIASSGAGLGGLAYNLAAERAVANLGWRWTYRILAFCSLGVNLICSILLKDRNSSVKPRQRAFDLKEFARVEILLVALWGVMTELGYIVLLYSLPNYATSIGLNAQQGAMAGALLNLGLGFGRPIVGYYSDTFGRINIAMLMTTLCGVLCLSAWISAKTYAVLLVFAILAGTACGTFWATVTPVIAEVAGMERLPSSFGMICVLLVLPTTFAESIALQMVQSSGYLSSQIFVGCAFLLGAACTLLLRTWKLHEIKMKAALEGQLTTPLVQSEGGLLPTLVFYLKKIMGGKV